MVTTKLNNVERLKRKLTQLPESVTRRLRGTIRRSAFKIHRLARRRVPVDTGRLRAGLQVILTDNDLYAEVGTNLEYAPYVEFGTGLLNDPPPGQPVGVGRPFFPPPSALEGWVGRHRKDFGITTRSKTKRADQIQEAAFTVAKAIWRRGGTPPRPFLFPSYEEVKPDHLRDVEAAIKQGIKDVL